MPKTEVVPMFPTAEAGTDIAPADLANDLIETGNSASSGTVNYMKFNKGEWLFGVDNDEVDADEIMAVNPASFTIGYQGWQDGSPVNGPVVPVSRRAELPAEADLDPIPSGDMNGWSKQLGVSFRSMEDQTPLQFNTTSYGGKQAITKLMKEVGEGLKAHIDAPVALVKLSSDSYPHKKYGKVYTPIITIVGWADASGKAVEKYAA